MKAAIEELEKSLSVEQGNLNDCKRKLERVIERKPILEQNIQDIESKIKDFEASIFVLKQMAEV
ncbi:MULTISPECIES: hypothetical protein [Bacillus]|uniref:Uncharacterized protein n=1 Tax=Bacillus thuringiensis TaxID=1428 RepID=A0A9X6V555_BACTU|nr:hypothetical protein [Bacillus thuringiensis]KIP28211.1 hypothetical protein BG10_2072 [Bacillus thuringiensis serovar morrisoni]MCT6945007.1 hypothetical protein [Bacillus thuringiensis]MED2074035.1 hypothetical protein [Bacillus thuringiensis]MEE2010711.1 hypothetical protein [Bacillus thuringiensis]NUW53279.1 hypothetical protein [Bacillus thuringiensis]